MGAYLPHHLDVQGSWRKSAPLYQTLVPRICKYLWGFSFAPSAGAGHEPRSLRPKKNTGQVAEIKTTAGRGSSRGTEKPDKFNIYKEERSRIFKLYLQWLSEQREALEPDPERKARDNTSSFRKRCSN